MFTPFKNDYCSRWFHGNFGGRIGYGHAGGISGFSTASLYVTGGLG